jgi:hypothetical protein
VCALFGYGNDDDDDESDRINSLGGQESSSHGATALIVAIEEGLTMIAKTLVKANADPNSKMQ